MRAAITLTTFLIAAFVAHALPDLTLAQSGEGNVTVSTRSAKFSDSDPVEWKGRAPRRYPVHGIDVARFQGEVDWRKARRAGVNFVFMKATEGGDLLDPMFKTHWRGAGKAGIPRGAYHFYYFCTEPEVQARWFIRNVPRVADALPPVLDMEWNHKSPTCKTRPKPNIVRAEARKFLNILERHYGQRPVVYTTPDFYEKTGIGRLRGTQFWLRSVADHPQYVYPGARWTFWQYTGTGVVPGVEGPVDINVFAGSPDAFRAWPG